MPETPEQAPAADRLFALIASIPGSGTVDWCGPARELLAEHRAEAAPVDRAALLAEAIARVEDPEQRALTTTGLGLGWEAGRDVLRRMAAEKKAPPYPFRSGRMTQHPAPGPGRLTQQHEGDEQMDHTEPGTHEPTRFAWMRDGLLVTGILKQWAGMWEGDYYAGDQSLTRTVLTWDGENEPVVHWVSVEKGEPMENDYIPYTFTLPGLHDHVRLLIKGRA